MASARLVSWWCHFFGLPSSYGCLNSAWFYFKHQKGPRNLVTRYTNKGVDFPQARHVENRDWLTPLRGQPESQELLLNYPTQTDKKEIPQPCILQFIY